MIDDAYNSNPVGAAAALEVLASHQAERRLLVTPGHGGARRARGRGERALRQAAPPRCATSWCWSARSARGRSGPASTRPSFPDDRIHVVANASEAQALLAKTTRRGDVVLFENDLPDLYAEDGNGVGKYVSAPMTQQGQRVAVLFGGPSVEHDVSIISAQQLMAVMEPRHEPIPVYLARDGRWWTGDALRDIGAFGGDAARRRRAVRAAPGPRRLALRGARRLALQGRPRPPGRRRRSTRSTAPAARTAACSARSS